MIQPVDLNSIDNINNTIIIPDDFISTDELETNEEIIKDQYINFNNLGINLIDNIDNKYKPEIYANMLNYINDNYLSIVDFDSSIILPPKLIETGNYIYNFICVDCYNTIIPNFLNYINCNNLDGFDSLIQNKFRGDYSLVKANLVKIIKNIVDELLKLQRIDTSVQKDEMYQKLLFKFTYYIELVDFGDTELFVNNYIRPLLIKNIDSILWRII
ncbi:MAG TPA: hypothetical protein PLL26_05925 [Candidatus Dojkabacteria bacterium]|nr:hypothetical protein [Candidatus Dojkabacteria bacterium]